MNNIIFHYYIIINDGEIKFLIQYIPFNYLYKYPILNYSEVLELILNH